MKQSSTNGSAATFYLEPGLHARIKTLVYSTANPKAKKPSVSAWVSEALASALAKAELKASIRR